jgi:hypothetical protein
LFENGLAAPPVRIHHKSAGLMLGEAVDFTVRDLDSYHRISLYGWHRSAYSFATLLREGVYGLRSAMIDEYAQKIFAFLDIGIQRHWCKHYHPWRSWRRIATGATLHFDFDISRLFLLAPQVCLVPLVRGFFCMLPASTGALILRTFF